MEFLAGTILAGTGGLLIATDVSLYKRRDELFHPAITLGFGIVLTLAYYLSLYVVLS